MKSHDSFLESPVLHEDESLVGEEGDELSLLLHGVLGADGLLVEIQDMDGVAVLFALRQSVIDDLFLLFQFG